MEHEAARSAAHPGQSPFSEWLRAQLRARGMSQRQLAQQSGVEHSTISRLLSSNRSPSLGTATKLARALRALRDEQVMPEFVEAAPGHPTARVEYALRSDDQLSERDVRIVMNRYLAVRSRRVPRVA